MAEPGRLSRVDRPDVPERLALIGLGSNLGDPVAAVRAAIAALGEVPSTRVLRHSRLFRTEPWGMVAQPAFVNAVAELATGLSARALLDQLLALERRHGRCRDGLRWGPRVIDLDLLSLGDLVLDQPGLTLPHPRLAERAFVLAPLADLGPERVLPGIGRVGDLLARVDAAGCVPLLEVGHAGGE